MVEHLLIAGSIDVQTHDAAAVTPVTLTSVSCDDEEHAAARSLSNRWRAVFWIAVGGGTLSVRVFCTTNS